MSPVGAGIWVAVGIVVGVVVVVVVEVVVDQVVVVLCYAGAGLADCELLKKNPFAS